MKWISVIGIILLLTIIEAKLYYESPIPQLLKQEKEVRLRTSKKIQLIGITNNTATELFFTVMIFQNNDKVIRTIQITPITIA